jgi:hypothetical protein
MGGKCCLVGAKIFSPGSASFKAPRSFAAVGAKYFSPLQPAAFFPLFHRRKSVIN